jgi:hypothetical protein
MIQGGANRKKVCNSKMTPPQAQLLRSDPSCRPQAQPLRPAPDVLHTIFPDTIFPNVNV